MLALTVVNDTKWCDELLFLIFCNASITLQHPQASNISTGAWIHIRHGKILLFSHPNPHLQFQTLGLQLQTDQCQEETSIYTERKRMEVRIYGDNKEMLTCWCSTTGFPPLGV